MKKLFLAFWTVASLCTAQAAQVTSLTPQGEVARVRQVVAKFDEAVVRFGDPKAAAPLSLTCSDAQATRGTARWNSDREWVFQFDNDLPPGVNCTVQVRGGFTTPQGAALNTGNWRFSTGGPFVQQIRPYQGSRIDEEQFFALQLNGPATLQSLRDKLWCAVDGLGERVPVRLLEGEARNGLLKAMRWDKAAQQEPLRYATFACNRRLAPDARVQIVYGQGVATPSGVANSTERRFAYTVREPFAASFSCERENAQAPCLPLRPMTLSFNAPVPRKLAEQVLLKSAKDSRKPAFEQAAADGDAVVESVNFKPLFAESTAYTLELPRDFKDASGRALRNADMFPLKVSTGPMPPLAKFAAAPFGIVERFAEPDGNALFPITVRQVEPDLRAQAFTPGQVSQLQPRSDAEIIAWQRKVQFYNDFQVPRSAAARDVKGALPRALTPEEKDWVQSRMVSLLAGQANLRTVDLPRPAQGDPRPFEVVGIPLTPGFHVLEIASRRLGTALLDARHGEARAMYVRSSALVTNLAVHFKLGRENALAWVTTLDKGRVVSKARVRVSDCHGKELASAVTDAQGIARIEGLSPKPPRCAGSTSEEGEGEGREAYFVSARAADAGGVEELAFTWSDWQRGIEPWRFNFPTSREARPDERLHTVFDRSLLRAGETVSMKHLARSETHTGFGVPQSLPTQVVVRHVGSGQEFAQPLAWRTTATGGRSSETEFSIPAAARLGVYAVELRGGGGREGGGREGGGGYTSGEFRVEEFRLPVLQGRVVAAGGQPLVAARSVPVDVQVSYVAGGAARGLPVRVSALVRARGLSFADYDAFNFQPPRQRDAAGNRDEEEASASQDTRVVADKLPLTLDANGAGKLAVPEVPASARPRELLLEATYADPSGEVQTLRSVAPLWPAAVVAGIKTEGWVSARQNMRFQALALGLDGKPAAGVALAVRATARIVTTSRKRMVGGFYTYDNKTEVKDIGRVCEGRSDARGLLLCEAKLGEAGEVELVATATDAQGRTVQAASSVWVTRQGELWFGGEDHDRIDLLPEKKAYRAGETAKFQVRMPFRQATALVTVEREGIIESRVMQLDGDDPTVSLQVKDGWGPNVYVSVLALRGRLREVPWYSFFTWGFRAPREWWTAFWFEGREYIAPTAMVDLSKPAYRLGTAEIRVGAQAHALAVSVKADKESYPVRGRARVTVSARLPDGRPAANAEVALAAVDQALLELAPNTSWNLLDAMLQRRAWGVETATAHMEIIGRRHYGRKALPAGGGGGKSPTRELLDTLLLWNPRVVLNANGQATVEVPLNDALTSFRIVAVADVGTGLFGTGATSIRATQDLQIISGLPPLVREDDQFRAQFTLRNTTARAMKVELKPRATLLELAPQTVDIPAGDAREVAWIVKAPAQAGQGRFESLLWELEARDTSQPQGGARDALKASQRIVPAVPLTVQQATLAQLDGPFAIEVQAPAQALPAEGPKRGGLRMALQPRLAEGLPGVRDWFAHYPFVCLEQKTSKAIGLRDAKLWGTVVAQLPTYLDANGLAGYFPPREGDRERGSDTLTAYILAATHEAAALNPAFALPDEARAPMERGLIDFVEGRLQREFWSPRRDLDVRKLAALDALSRYGKAQGRMLASLTIAPNQWPTHAVIDWIGILKRVADAPQREQRLAEAMQVLKSRLSYQGTRVAFSTEREDYWWWLMANGDANTARLMLAVMDDAAWKDDMGRLASGFIARQQRGAWHTTTANLWGGLALEKFSAKFEAQPVAGVTRASLGGAQSGVEWSKVSRAAASDAAGVMHQGTSFGAPAAAGMLRNNGMFLPWDAASPAGRLSVTHQGSGKPWLTLQSLAAIDLKAPFSAGYRVKRSVAAVEQAVAGRWSRGDVVRVSIEVEAASDMTWVVLTDPVPGGATILGSGLGRDSQIATQGERRAGAAWTAFEERGFESYRAYYEYVPKGAFKAEYTLRLNNVGDFAVPPTRIEAMYAPEMFGEAPNARVKVEAR